MGKIFKSLSVKNRLMDKAVAIADKAIALESKFASLSNDELRQKTDYFISRLQKGDTIEDFLPEAFATIREACFRAYGLKAYRVQLIGAAIVHFGDFAEMMTGEGKTLVLVMASYPTALLKQGVHIISVNEYLVERDADFSRQAMSMLGLSVGFILAAMSNEEKRQNYNCDITYCSNSELGFDYLRDNMVKNYNEKVQRGLFFAIVDEADSILIDEARTPLIISGVPQESVSQYVKVDNFVSKLEREDYIIDLESHSIMLSEYGVKKAEIFFGLTNLYDIENSDIVHKITNALRANFIFRNGVEYIVRFDEKEGEDVIALVDHFTGRIMEGRSYSAGLQQAIQAKEKVKIEPENLTVATITYQSLFQLYKKLAGVSGTAATESEELLNIYNLVVVTIPTNKPVIRVDQPDYVFNTKKTKWKYVVAEVLKRHKSGQPILIGTACVEDSEVLDKLLTKLNINHSVLNAKNHAQEAKIIEQAGQYGNVTIATYMAGRGTDIKLSQESKDAGGLYVIGTERNEARRVDNQLRGRSGRQGDVGESRFFISLEDSLFKRFAGDKFEKAEFKIENEYIDTKFFSRLLNSTQKKIEGLNYDIRKNLIDYDHVLSNQRELVYKQRDAILLANDLTVILKKQFNYVADDLIQTFRSKNNPDLINLDDLIAHLNGILSNYDEESKVTINHFKSPQISEAQPVIINILENKLEKAIKTATLPIFNYQLKQVLIENIDQYWTTHLDLIQKLREGVSLRAYEQRSPLNIYIEDANRLFIRFKVDVAIATVKSIFMQVDASNTTINVNNGMFNFDDLVSLIKEHSGIDISQGQVSTEATNAEIDNNDINQNVLATDTNEIINPLLNNQTNDDNNFSLDDIFSEIINDNNSDDK